ncbi:hypothetical protein D3C85_1441080 [compost metagenome]
MILRRYVPPGRSDGEVTLQVDPFTPNVQSSRSACEATGRETMPYPNAPTPINLPTTASFTSVCFTNPNVLCIAPCVVSSSSVRASAVKVAVFSAPAPVKYGSVSAAPVNPASAPTLALAKVAPYWVTTERSVSADSLTYPWIGTRA